VTLVATAIYRALSTCCHTGLTLMASNSQAAYSLHAFLQTSQCSSKSHTLLHLYRSLVRSRLDFGSVIYGSARESYFHILDPLQNHALRHFHILDPLQNHALRLCLGAFRTSPASMCVQANEPPLYIRRRMLSIQCFLRLGSSPSNPAYNTVFSPKFEAFFSSKHNQVPTLGVRIAMELEKVGFKRKTVSWLSVPATAKAP